MLSEDNVRCVHLYSFSANGKLEVFVNNTGSGEWARNAVSSEINNVCLLVIKIFLNPITCTWKFEASDFEHRLVYFMKSAPTVMLVIIANLHIMWREHVINRREVLHRFQPFSYIQQIWHWKHPIKMRTISRKVYLLNSLEHILTKWELVLTLLQQMPFLKTLSLGQTEGNNC